VRGTCSSTRAHLNRCFRRHDAMLVGGGDAHVLGENIYLSPCLGGEANEVPC
jgi:hypothetical protein